ncbi:MAG TPA: amino acid-binding protein [Acidimicrobiia bacterium]
MATDLTIFLDDEPGELGRLGDVLGEAGVNIEGFCATTGGGGKAEVHVLVEDAAAAFAALGEARIEVASEAEVAVVAVDDHPGVLGEVSRKFGAAGANITVAYLATSTRLVFAADDLAAAKAALDELC